MSRTPGPQPYFGLQVLYLDESAAGLPGQVVDFEALAGHQTAGLVGLATSGLALARQTTGQTSAVEGDLETVDQGAAQHASQAPTDAAETSRATDDPLSGNFPGVDGQLRDAAHGIEIGAGYTQHRRPGETPGPPPDDGSGEVAHPR